MTDIDLTGTDDPHEVTAHIEIAARQLRETHQADTDQARREAILALAKTMLWIRKHCPRGSDPPPDLRGRFHPYRLIVAKIRHDAAGTGRPPMDIPKQIGHKINELIFDDPDIDPETRTEFGFGSEPSHKATRREWRRARSRERVFGEVEPQFQLIDNIREITAQIEQLRLSLLDSADDDTRAQVRDLMDRLALISGERREETRDIVDGH